MEYNNKSETFKGTQTGVTPVVLISTTDTRRFVVHFAWLQAVATEFCSLELGAANICLRTEASGSLQAHGGPWILDAEAGLIVDGTGAGAHLFSVTVTPLATA